MSLELDLRKIKLLAEQNEEKNWRFRSFLKFKGDSRIDRIVPRLYQKLVWGLTLQAVEKPVACHCEEQFLRRSNL